MADLGTLGCNGSFAAGINELGVIVGHAQSDCTQPRCHVDPIERRLAIV
jgi:uncharacterized membrane protein